jgi:hypothetical protein
MAEDDKYVPSEGNKKLDPTASAREAVSRALDAEQAAYVKRRDDGRAAAVANYIAGREKSMAQDGLEVDSEGTLRSSGPNGYENSYDYRRKEQTKAARAHITERTWGKWNRGQTQDMYGNKMSTLHYVNSPQRAKPPKKSDINRSMSPKYGQPTGSPLFNETVGSEFAGVMGWIGRFPPNVCGPSLVMAFSNKGGYYQSNVQEASNNGRPIKATDSWA